MCAGTKQRSAEKKMCAMISNAQDSGDEEEYVGAKSRKLERSAWPSFYVDTTAAQKVQVK